MRTMDDKAIQAKGDSDYRETLIRESESFILGIAHKAAGQYVSYSDDEWSVSLLAFHEAIEAYSAHKGHFLPFAELVIRRRLADSSKQQRKYQAEIPVNPRSFGGEYEEEEEDLSLRLQVLEGLETREEFVAKWEILALNQTLMPYGFSFLDLVEASPKTKKTKVACAKAVASLWNDSQRLKEMRNSCTLPIQFIVAKTWIQRKVIERHRKYIIAAIEIFTGDYPILAEYLRFMKEELKT